MALLILVRHGETTWNALDRLTGTADISISKVGRKQAQRTAKLIHPYAPTLSYVSSLKRTRQTFNEIASLLPPPKLSLITTDQLNERDCGDYTGYAKENLKELIGKEEITLLESDWCYTPPNGESLMDVHERVISFFNGNVVPDLRQNKDVLIVSHYNPMRLLMGYLEGLPLQQRGNVQVANAELVVYSVTIDSRSKLAQAKRIKREGHARSGSKE
jgi:2,3-bisphosphoglycerate-dependent phosphoglycerate mutase